MTILAVLLAGGLLAADPKTTAAPVPVTNDADMKAVVETIQSLSGMLDNLGSAADSLAEGDDKNAKADDKTVKQGRPLKNTVAIITAGAAAGASIGAATKKGTQAIVIGAIAGAAAGLIYDRMTAEKKNNPEPAAAEGVSASETSKETKPIEVNKQNAKPAPAV